MKRIKIPRARLIAAAAVLGTVSVVGVTAPASATDMTIQTTCGDDMDVDITGGVANWKASCGASTITVSGWVKDTKADGKCARVKARINNQWHYSARACPSGDKEDFRFFGSGRSASVYLYVEDA